MDAHYPLIQIHPRLPLSFNIREERTLRLIIAILPITDIELWINLKDLFLKHLDPKISDK